MSTTISSLSLPSSRIISYGLTPAPSRPDAPIVLLSNSLSAPFTAWDHVVPKLTSQGLSVLRYDQPGHGASTAPADLSSTTFESLADDVRELLRHLSIGRLHAWIGVSMGAATGMVFAAKYPGIIRKLVVCDTISCSPVNIGAADVFAPRIAAAREAGNMDAVTDGTLDRWFGRAWLEANPVEARRMRELMSGTSIDGFETCCAAIQSETFDLRPLAEGAGKGVDEALFIVGEKDANLPETMKPLRERVEQGLRTKDRQATVDFEVIKNAGHVCYVDGYDQFIAIMSKFLE
ncbi:zearalenone lactonase [Durotheca rogersii]|uniref:zearalenone lactonase n=1 Tax=Durotheca rogersii TaxID=419775 RepID=UPI0022208838|nr:zearalenone lactonase [Durotheca rogersii]KAI5857495.1 zearalenone lactonase [Durotheca rogersii]